MYIQMEPRRIYSNPIKHYYGDIVRILFVAGAVITILGLPVATRVVGIPAIIPIIMAAILVIAAGITNPAQQFSLELNVGISILFLVVFGYMGWSIYEVQTGGTIAFMYQLNAILFLFASYFSVKSLRGAVVPEK